MNKISKFKVIGERNSGTNLMSSLIKENTQLEEVDSSCWFSHTGHKHFFTKETISLVEDDTLVIAMVRSYPDWVNSMRVRPYHLQWNLHKLKIDPLDTDWWTQPFYSVKGSTFPKPEERDYVWNDLDPETKQPDKTIAHSRNRKMKFLLDELPNLVQHSAIIKFEILKDDQLQILTQLADEFQFNVVANPKLIETHKGIKNIKVERVKHQTWTANHIYQQSPALDLTQEARLGYIISSKV